MSDPLPPPLEPIELRISDSVGVALGRRRARQLARGLGFSRTDVERIVIAVSELGHNLWKHARGGTLTLEPLVDPRPGIRVITVDSGPGIADVARALQDGSSSRGTIGSGLAAVGRLMDEFQIDSEPGKGTRMEAIKWLS